MGCLRVSWGKTLPLALGSIALQREQPRGYLWSRSFLFGSRRATSGALDPGICSTSAWPLLPGSARSCTRGRTARTLWFAAGLQRLGLRGGARHGGHGGRGLVSTALLPCGGGGLHQHRPPNHHLGRDSCRRGGGTPLSSAAASPRSPFLPEHLFWSRKTCRGAEENRQRVNHSGPTGLKINPSGGEEQPLSPRISAGLRSVPPKPTRGCPPWAPSLSSGFYCDTLAYVCVCLHVRACGRVHARACTCTLANTCTHAHACTRMRMGPFKHVHSCTRVYTRAHARLQTHALLYVLAHPRAHTQVRASTHTLSHGHEAACARALSCMFLHACARSCNHVHTLAAHARACTHSHTLARADLHTLDHACMCAHLHTHAHACTDLHGLAHAHTRACNIRAHACTLLHTHPHAHTRLHTPARVWQCAGEAGHPQPSCCSGSN